MLPRSLSEPLRKTQSINQPVNQSRPGPSAPPIATAALSAVQFWRRVLRYGTSGTSSKTSTRPGPPGPRSLSKMSIYQTPSPRILAKSLRVRPALFCPNRSASRSSRPCIPFRVQQSVPHDAWFLLATSGHVFLRPSLGTNRFERARPDTVGPLPLSRRF